MEEEEEDLDTLGEQLYNRIYPTHKEISGKLTGMLLELPAPILKQMLQDETVLASALDRAFSALQLEEEPSKENKEDGSASSDSVGEQLFELVDLHNTGHAQKITGMLLEQHRDTVLKLLSEPKLLEEQINLALKILEELRVQETEGCDSSDTEDAERLGERLFALVEELDPLHANDITGMLLEMEPASLQLILGDNTMLEAAVRKAQAARGP